MMRVLTVRQPYAWAIVHGGKDVENRVRNVAGSYRGLVAIHAGLAEPERNNAASRRRAQLRREGAEVDTRLVFGAIIGVVDLVDVHVGSEYGDGCYRAPAGTSDYAIPVPTCSVWAEPDAYHLMLANPRPLVEPIPFRGALGLRTLPADVEAAVLAAGCARE